MIIRKVKTNTSRLSAINLSTIPDLLCKINKVAESLDEELKIDDLFEWDLNIFHIAGDSKLHLIVSATGPLSIDRFKYNLEVENAMLNLDIPNGSINISMVDKIPSSTTEVRPNINESRIAYEKYMDNREVTGKILEITLKDDDIIDPITVYMNGYSYFHLPSEVLSISELIIDEVLSLMYRIDRLEPKIIEEVEKDLDTCNADCSCKSLDQNP